jgi:hypothetical protein
MAPTVTRAPQTANPFIRTAGWSRLSNISAGSQHGYGIVTDIKELSGGRVLSRLRLAGRTL